MTGKDVAMLVVALAAAGGALFVLRGFFKRLEQIQAERWGEGRYESRLNEYVLWRRKPKQK